MSKYQIGDRLKFIHGDAEYRIHAGDTAMIVGLHRCGWCVHFDREIFGHDCDMPDVVIDGNGLWLIDSYLDQHTFVVTPHDDQIDISSLNLEDVL